MYDFAIFWDWLSLAVRWLHVITGIAWIGSSFYFVALDLGPAATARPARRARSARNGRSTAVASMISRNIWSRRPKCPST